MILLVLNIGEYVPYLFSPVKNKIRTFYPYNMKINDLANAIDSDSLTIMTVLRFLLTFFLLLAVPSFAFAGCADKKGFKTATKIDLSLPNALFDQSKTLKEMNEDQSLAHEQWLKKNGMETVWKASSMETYGLAAGGFGTAMQFAMTGKPYGPYGLDGCLYFKSIDFSMIYRTIISIPKEFMPGSCIHKVIFVHEMKHHNTNAEIVRKAVARFEKDLPVMVAHMEKSAAGVNHRFVQDEYKSMQQKMRDALDVYLKQEIAREMERQNSAIDSPEEYTSGSLLIKECRSLGE